MNVGFEKITCKSFVGRREQVKMCVSSTDYVNSAYHKFKSQVSFLLLTGCLGLHYGIKLGNSSQSHWSVQLMHHSNNEIHHYGIIC